MQRDFGSDLSAGVFPVAVSRVVALFAYEIHAPEQVGVGKDSAEVRVAEQADQSGVGGHGQLVIDGIHPFDGVFHRAAAIEHASAGVDGIDFFGGDGCIRKYFKLRVGFEIVEVGHGRHLLSLSMYK